MAASSKTILVTGATGYVGGRLVGCLLKEVPSYSIRCFARSPDRLRGRPWASDVDVVKGDVLEPETLPPAMEGVDAAYYLIHSLGAGEDAFAERDRRAARNFGRAAGEAGIDQIIYLGGMRPKGNDISAHLRSRLETGEALRESGVPVTEFRAAVIVGSGSLSFELVRYLTERLPVMICPRWVHTPAQPIAVRNALQYLMRALDTPECKGEIIEIGGGDVLTYGDMFMDYAKVRGLRRTLINVPFLTPRLSSHWVGLVTPLNNATARPLIKGLGNEVVVKDSQKARRLFPQVKPMSYEAAVRLALRRFAEGEVPTTWHGTAPAGRQRGVVETLKQTEGMIKEVRRLRVKPPPPTTFSVIERIGGEAGWYYADALWRLRGYLDLLVGGIGYRKGRRDPDTLRVGDAVDFWRVEAVNRPHLLRLRAEMKVGGRAWLQFNVEESDDPSEERTLITQTAYFEPKGLFGLLYWYALYLPHHFIFPGMIEEIGRRAEAQPTSKAERRSDQSDASGAPV